jgi:Na+-transporting NADH:ubiquinone oxidoreductase subunit NqrF
LQRLAEESLSSNQSLSIRVDGPHGSSNVKLDDRPISIYVAGGIGITPIIAMIRHVFDIVEEPVVQEIRDLSVWNQDTRPRQHHIYLIWVVQAEVRTPCFVLADYLACQSWDTSSFVS